MSSAAGLSLSFRVNSAATSRRKRLITVLVALSPNSPSSGVSVPPRSESTYGSLPAVPGALATRRAFASTSKPVSSESASTNGSTAATVVKSTVQSSDPALFSARIVMVPVPTAPGVPVI